ncbi:SCT1 [Candida pseudojiufengensis]|uniref:SCT1 n=1 Tax=Candida pseudojiufengensis TaxID=497109 RepID=UPI002224D619|nr:SCT1 [Candida pseudojiufengensis]KAI5959605.1 SCT1 [Candida pseudojiufengensis]
MSNNDYNLKYKPAPWYRLLSYDFLLWALSIVFDCFFREIRPRGAFKIPRDGPVMFVAAPHHNQFVDPIILMNQVKKEANRRISFLIAAKSYQKKIVGSLAKCQLSIPVVRPQDTLVKGTGKIYADSDDPCRIYGKGTKFTTECMDRGLIALPQSLGATEISEVISDTELFVRKEFKQTQQIKLLLSQGTSFKKADKIDQKDVYKMVFDHLSDNNCIGIFPEGGSHDRPTIGQIKAGSVIMALGAMEADPNCDVKIVPCGMNYFNAHRFRSRAVIEFGDPITIPRELVKKYSNPETRKEAIKDLLDTITDGLKAVTVSCEDYETLMLVQAARRLYAGNFAQQLPLPLIVEMNRRLLIGYQHYSNEPKIIEVKEKVLEYNELLKSLYLPDHHVEDCQEEVNKAKIIPILIYRVLKLIILFTLALPGATLFSPVFLSSKVISQQKAKEALANSTVKIKGNDVIATWKILVALLIAPIVYSFYATLGTYYCATHNYLSSFGLLTMWIFLYLCGVLVTYSALLTGEQGVDLFKSIRPLYLSITSGSSIKRLKKMRHELSEEITELVNEFGPQLFPKDFNLLEIKKSLNLTDDINYVDSDEEEEKKTQDLRSRRLEHKKLQKRLRENTKNHNLEPELMSESISHSSSISDGISLLDSTANSYTNLPIFSDHSLHQNVNNKALTLDPQSNFNSSLSLYDDHKHHLDPNQSHNNLNHSYVSSPLRGKSATLNSNSSSSLSNMKRIPSEDHMELNFTNKNMSLKNRIKDKMRKNRQL